MGSVNGRYGTVEKMDHNTAEQKNAALVRELAAECMLFLKRDGSFPLAQPCRVALFGNGARNTIRGGTGSGEVYSRHVVNMEDGLVSAGFTVTTKDWLDQYDRMRAAEREKWIRAMKKEHRGIRGMFAMLGAVMPESEYEFSLDYPGDVCIYVLSRISGEGSDRAPEAGDILLTETEIRDIRALDRKFEKFLLVLNVGGPVDLSEVAGVRNILLFSQAGPSSGEILSDILLGRSDPCGKLATTWTAWDEYGRIGEFGDPDETRYREGIYVGYRYFGTVGKDPMFPFGYGRSYTDFSVGEAAVSLSGSDVRVTVPVQNIGKYAGKEVIQVYVSVPSGKLDQPYQALAAFGKTHRLQPGENETVTVGFDLKDMTSYDTDNVCYLLEAGDYLIRVGNSCVQTAPVAVVEFRETVVVRKVRNVLGDCGFEDWKPERREEKEEDPAAGISDLPRLYPDISAFAAEEISYDREEEIDPFIAGLSDEELCYTGIGQFHGRPFSIIGNSSSLVAGAAGDLTTMLEEKGFPGMSCADGPAGLRIEREYYRDRRGLHAVNNDAMQLFAGFVPAFLEKILIAPKKKKGAEIHTQYCTMIPTATAVAQSFDTELGERLGRIVGEEMERYGVDIWLGPAMNIHRDIRCGRNFEYYSEDPVLTGKMAAAVVCGVQSCEGRYATIKHFAANNQETNRYGSNSLVSERALREIYLRGFEICIRDARPGAVMTSYNLLNGIHTAMHEGLIEDVLRSEFGFRGIVMTDWLIRNVMGGGKNPLPQPWEIAAAGGEVLMPGSRAEYKELRKGLRKGKVTRKQMEIHAARIYRLARNGK